MINIINFNLKEIKIIISDNMETDKILKRLKELHEEGEEVKATVNRVQHPGIIDFTPILLICINLLNGSQNVLVFLKKY